MIDAIKLMKTAIFIKELEHWYRSNEPFLKDRAHHYALLMRLDKPIGTFLLLWPTLWALWIASQGIPSIHLLIVFSAGVFLTRSAGCVMNDYADRDFDRHVTRTRHRPLTTGIVTPREAFILITSLLAVAFLLVLTTNRLTILLAFIALPIGGIYPYMKRYTYVPQLFQGLSFSWGIIMAFAAATNGVPRIAWLIFIANILWSMIYDTTYAMVDREDDIRIGVKSTAILVGDSDRLFIGIMQGMMFLVFLIIGHQLEFGAYYHLSLLAAAAVAAYHQYLIKDRRPDQCFRAFLINNWLGAVVLAGIILHYLFNRPT
jgi:4-hydroxybenzoate polyprenyltransferase